MKRMNLDRFLKKGKGFVLAFSCLLMFLFIGIQDASAQNIDGTPTLPTNFVSESVALNVMQTQLGVFKTQLQTSDKEDLATLNAQIDAYTLVWEDLTLGSSVSEAYVRVTTVVAQSGTSDSIHPVVGAVNTTKIINDLTTDLTN